MAWVAAACPPGAIVSQRNDGAIMLDLPAAVRAQLEAVGVCHIEDSGVCTACHVDEFVSHRVENARTGRFGVVIGLTP